MQFLLLSRQKGTKGEQGTFQFNRIVIVLLACFTIRTSYPTASNSDNFRHPMAKELWKHSAFTYPSNLILYVQYVSCN